MFNLTRTPGSSHGGTSQSGGAQRRRAATPRSAKGVGSRTKEASGARLRNSSRRSKNVGLRDGIQRHRFPQVLYNCVGIYARLSNRGSDEKKDKGGEKTPEHHNNSEHEAGSHPKLVHVETNRGTAV